MKSENETALFREQQRKIVNLKTNDRHFELKTNNAEKRREK